MTVRDFVTRLRDDLQRFQLAVERARTQHPGLFPESQNFNVWLRAFLVWLRDDRNDAAG